jgi:hypothetical protein
MSERYCRRCGEDAWEFYRCHDCGDEFCSDCGGAHRYCDLCPECLAQRDEEAKLDEAKGSVR